MLEDIYLPHLAKAPHSRLSLDFEEFFPDLETLVPVVGKIEVHHGGTFLEVMAQAHTILTLTCDRTLVQFNHRLAIDTREIIWLGNPGIPAAEQEIALEDLEETLSPEGYFPAKFWIYEQLCLAIPFPAIAPDAPDWQSIVAAATQEPSHAMDNRWAALRNFQLPD